ncbi:hypothetical protein JOF48_003448 [Arthrobacter stackebrandtii]|uniref:Uncharacterized protein n=1 Tax=Arthrobacter stackebrandtii TaxID=272161 RepID=A0ABS4Z0Y9_9MICC|nr:hypothetical protein [Arthrobacter stackebrandtii]
MAQAAAILTFSMELLFGGRNLSNRVGRDDIR